MTGFAVSAPQRLDQFLSSAAGHLTRNRAQRMIKMGKVRVNGSVIKKPAMVLKEGDRVDLEAIDVNEPSTAIKPVDLHLDVLYEDDYCLVINKPAGIAVHPASSMQEDAKTLLNGIAYLFRERAIPCSSDAVLVHRLDKDTTGCLLVAKTPEAHEALQRQFERREVTKIYLALVIGVPSLASAKIDAPIGRNLVKRTLMSIFKTSTSREAKTTYRTLEAHDDSALLECVLHTGRTHQARVHLRSIGHPILGDRTYATSQSNEMSKKYAIKGLCLHAWKLAFISPAKKERIGVEAPKPHWVVQWSQA